MLGVEKMPKKTGSRILQCTQQQEACRDLIYPLSRQYSLSLYYFLLLPDAVFSVQSDPSAVFRSVSDGPL